MRSVELKIKRKNLADEARTIRAEELAAKKARDTALVENLHNHRINKVRPAARHAHLANAFLRGTPYDRVEAPGSRPFDVTAVAREIRTFGSDATREITTSKMEGFVVAWSDPETLAEAVLMMANIGNPTQDALDVADRMIKVGIDMAGE